MNSFNIIKLLDSQPEVLLQGRVSQQNLKEGLVTPDSIPIDSFQFDTAKCHRGTHSRPQSSYIARRAMKAHLRDLVPFINEANKQSKRLQSHDRCPFTSRSGVASIQQAM